MTIYAEIQTELERAGAKYEERFHSLNEALGTIYGEFCELRQEIVGHGPHYRVREEAVQVAAMAVKLVQYLDKETMK